jgi:hypothetical protein
MNILKFLKNKTAPYILAGGLVASTFTGCQTIQREYSNVLHEDAVVVTKIHTPSHHEPDLQYKVMDVGDNLAITADGEVRYKAGDNFSIGTDGDLGINIGNNFVLTSSDVPEQYGAVFRCKHGSFTSQGSDQRHKDLYNKLQENQKVDVTYREIYRATYGKDVDKDGEKDLIERVLISYDFLNANPKQE